MVYVFSTIKEIKTMKLEDMEVRSELGRNIYAVRFMGRLKDVKKERSKYVITITDGEDELDAIYFPGMMISARTKELSLRRGRTYIFFAHLEPQNRICYIDFFTEADIQYQLRFLIGLFITYFELTFRRSSSATGSKL